MTRNYETRLPRCVLLGRTLLAMTNGIFIDTLNNNAAIIPTQRDLARNEVKYPGQSYGIPLIFDALSSIRQ
ncbi:MAG TPA: hypothetical protein DDW84_02085 [Phycisphaerales bacterium]|nr:MAG: hypothetical protein A2Y13_09880 [Planctomycetes bacterium GWC2_45_44]HBG77626.1 hypothetical protein [Phycisphaerales bacterium]HBR19308.1 hypothetical protein [Phycisphaerales bacterium]